MSIPSVPLFFLESIYSRISCKFLEKQRGREIIPKESQFRQINASLKISRFTIYCLTGQLKAFYVIL